MNEEAVSKNLREPQQPRHERNTRSFDKVRRLLGRVALGAGLMAEPDALTAHNLDKLADKVADFDVIGLVEGLGKTPINIPDAVMASKLVPAIEAHNEKMIAELDPEFQPQVREILAMGEKFNVIVAIKSGHRSIEEQEAAYAQGRTKPGKIVTQVRGGDSWHNHRRAVDLIAIDPDTGGRIFGDKSIPILTALARQIQARHPEIVWGGVWDLKDYPHFESHKNLTIAQAKSARGIKPVITVSQR